MTVSEDDVLRVHVKVYKRMSIDVGNFFLSDLPPLPPPLSDPRFIMKAIGIKQSS